MNTTRLADKTSMKPRICFVGVRHTLLARALTACALVLDVVDPDGRITREGLGVAVRDMEEMRQAIRELTTNRETWLATGARCVAFMRREFNEDRILAPYLDTFHQLADQGVRA
jgi:hypothetical protein